MRLWAISKANGISAFMVWAEPVAAAARRAAAANVIVTIVRFIVFLASGPLPHSRFTRAARCTPRAEFRNPSAAGYLVEESRNRATIVAFRRTFRFIPVNPPVRAREICGTLTVNREAELIAVGGSISGMRFPLGPAEVRAGRSPDAEIRLQDSAAAWEHCVVRSAGGSHVVIDATSETGTFVNGRRISECRLQPGDRIAIGETVLLYRRSCDESGRALVNTENEGYRETIESQLLELIAEMVDCEGCAVMLGRSPDEIRLAAPHSLASLAGEALFEG